MATEPHSSEPTPPSPKRRGGLAFWRRPKASEEDLRDRRIRKWAELWETLIVTLATVATVWAGYQAGLWNSDETDANNQATTLRLESTLLANRGNQLRAIDIGLFTDWVDAYAVGNTRLADFYRARFRDEFMPAMDAWLASDPLNNPDAANSPFELPEYRLATLEQAAALLAQAEELSLEGESAGNTADQYTLSIVILAASLLLAGVANQFEWEELRAVVVTTALIVLLVSTIYIVRLPVG
jgi:hypothetical protein